MGATWCLRVASWLGRIQRPHGHSTVSCGWWAWRIIGNSIVDKRDKAGGVHQVCGEGRQGGGSLRFVPIDLNITERSCEVPSG